VVLALLPLVAPRLHDALLDALEAREESLDRAFSGEHVDDRARLLGPLSQSVEGLAAAFWTDLAIDVQVVTLHDDTPDVSLLVERLFEERRDASRASTGAMLVLLEAGRQLARIEVSYELEGALPDVVVNRVAADQLAPYASYGAAGMAVMDVLHFLKDHALDQAARGQLPLADELKAGSAYRERLAQLSGGAGARVTLPDIPADDDLKRTVTDEDRARYAPSSDPLESIDALRRVMRDLVGDPSLELFTPGSRVMRRLFPVAPYEEARRLAVLEASMPLTLTVEGNRAVARSRQPARGFVPVLLLRSDRLWRIDMVETWKNLFFGGDGEYRLVNRNTPYWFGLEDLGPAPWHDVAALELGGEPLDEALARLEARSDARSRLWLAELLFRNCWATTAALSRYREALDLAPNDPEILRVYAERASYLWLTDLAIPLHKRRGPAGWGDVARSYGRAGRHDKAERYYRRALRLHPESPELRAGLIRALERQQKYREAHRLRDS
jgi:hypothetical protein